MKVLLVEDDEMHLTYLKEQVGRTLGDDVELTVARNGSEAEDLARTKQINAIVMDLRMRDRNGIEAARVIWRERPGTRILFWSNYSDEAYQRGIARIVPQNASYGYVLKTASSDRLSLALQAVLVEGQVMIDREVYSMQNSAARSSQTLTEVEYGILLDVAIGLPDKVIAERKNLSLRTVQNRLITLYEKLEELDQDVLVSEVPMNKRVRTVANALTRKLINQELLAQTNQDFRQWLASKR